MAGPPNFSREDLGKPHYRALFRDEDRLTEAAPTLRALVANASVSVQGLYDFIVSIPILPPDKLKVLRKSGFLIALTEVLLHRPLYEWCAAPRYELQDVACGVSVPTIH